LLFHGGEAGFDLSASAVILAASTSVIACCRGKRDQTIASQGVRRVSPSQSIARQSSADDTAPGGASNDQAPRLQPIDTTTLHERAYAHLKKAMMAGLFRPGEAVTLRGVAEALGTSVMPVREAVRRLVSERALEMPTSRSIRVPLMSRERFDDLCRCRLLLEGEAASLAARKADAGTLEQLEALNRDIADRVRSGDMAAMLAANQAFHFAVYSGCGSELLISMIEALWLQGGPYLNLLTSLAAEEDAIEVDNSEHEKLIGALAKRDANAARAAVRADITEAAKLYRSRIEDV
jgi:DNA-binding GntR family transcriptional regulator